MKENFREFTVSSNDLYDWHIDPLLSIEEGEKEIIKNVLFKIQNKYYKMGYKAGLKFKQKQFNESNANCYKRILAHEIKKIKGENDR